MNKTLNDMNNITNQIPLQNISIPELNSAEFATGLQNAFININKNFALLANHDFVKGEAGQSVSIQDNEFFDNTGKMTILGQKLKACIEGNASEGELVDVQYTDENNKLCSISVWDNFKPETASKIQMIYSQTNDTTEPEPVSSLYYVFLDARYANDKIGSITRDDVHALQYANLKDMSCILVYDKDVSVTINQNGTDYTVNGGFKILTNTFPTIYYESNVGLCWKINGSNTGIPVQGLPGRDGHNAITRIVKCDNVSKTEYGVVHGVVSQIHNNFNGYENINDKDDLSIYDNNAALILVTMGGNGFDSGFYFGQLKVEDNVLHAYCHQQNFINYGLSIQTIIEAMKHIDITANGTDVSQGLKGLYIPISSYAKNSEQSVHLISSTTFSDNKNDATVGDKSDLIFTPIENVNDNNSLDIIVEKYLRVKINKDDNFFGSNGGCQISNLDALTKSLEDCNYELKYKLSGVAIGERSTILSNSKKFIELIDNNKGVKLQLSSGNTVYFDESGPSYKNNDIVSMPSEFRTKLGSTGIYVWELTKECENLNEYFNTIFTTTITPGVTTNFLWFNGSQIVDNEYFGVESNLSSGDKSVVPGWYIPKDVLSGNETGLFSFIGFEPLYNNDNEYKGDTSLNFNYNVNISGTKDNSNKNLTVNGAVNCNDLRVYNVGSIKELRNIYTKDDIIGDAGIKLGVDNTDGTTTYDTVISNGDIVTQGNITTNSMQVNNNISVAGNVSARNVMSTVFEIPALNDDNKRFLYAASSKDDLNMELNISNLKINANDDSKNESNIYINAPSTHKKNVIITNQDDTSNTTLDTNTSFKSAVDKYVGSYNDGSKKVTSGNPDSKSYNASADTTALTNILNENNAHNMYKTAAACSGSNNTFHITRCNKLTVKSDLNNSIADTNKIMCKFDINSNNSDTITTALNTNTDIIINFNTDYLVRVCCYGKCDNGYRPKLKNTSTLTLRVYYGDNNGLKEIESSKKVYNFNNDVNGGNIIWTGKTSTGGTFGNNYDWEHRFNDFIFKPNTMTISSSSEGFGDIAYKYKNGKSIEIYVVADYKLEFVSEKSSKEVIKGAMVYRPIPITEKPNPSKTEKSNNNLVVSAEKVYKLGQTATIHGNNDDETKASILKYNYVEYNTSQIANTTLLCNDGFVIKSGNKSDGDTFTYIFGLGMYDPKKTDENIQLKPSLVYYNSINNTDPNNPEPLYISLDDLFTKLETIKLD